jgi:FixJ family two-component response regulator
MTARPEELEPRPLVLLVEDDDGARRSLQLLLLGRGFRVRSFAAAAPAIADPMIDDAAVLIADYRLPDSDGLTLLADLRERGWGGRAILVSAYASGKLATAATAAGFDAMIEKPLRHSELLAAIGAALA